MSHLLQTFTFNNPLRYLLANNVFVFVQQRVGSPVYFYCFLVLIGYFLSCRSSCCFFLFSSVRKFLSQQLQLLPVTVTYNKIKSKYPVRFQYIVNISLNIQVFWKYKIFWGHEINFEKKKSVYENIWRHNMQFHLSKIVNFQSLVQTHAGFSAKILK